ncbi:MAG: hypothetical protein ACI4S3_06040 [Candidatus Gastranaerophilaceae bacterium]
MPDIQVEKESKFKKLSKDDRNELAIKISKLWSDFHKKRTTQIDVARELEKEIFLNQGDRNKNAQWKGNIKENKIATTWDSMKSSMWKEIWSNEEQMFDVQGTDKEFEEVSDKQKQAIVHALKRMEAGVQFDKASDSWAVYGDFVFKTDWKSRKKKVKRFDPYQGMIEVELPLEENAHIEAINPMFFNFDVTKYKYGDKESWDSCPKIYKRFASLEEIKSNPIYKLTKEQEAELDIDDETKTTDKKSDDNLATMKKYGELYEVLFLHGDIKFNGVLYKNVVAEVLAGKFLIFFDENPVYINPFIWDCTQLDPETGRGVSPLKCILKMSQSKEELINKVYDISALNANPPVWANDTLLKDKYKDKENLYEPGKVIEYENSYQGGFPQQVKFDGSGIADIVSVLANDISDASAINANVMGNIEQGKRTATEMQLASNGSGSRIAMKLDKIYQINLKVIENVAELLAMFKNEPEILLVRDKGQRVAVEINNAIRRGSYYYVYEDRNALIDRRAKIQEAFNMLNAAANNPVLFERIDWVEALKTGLESSGFDNPDKFFKEPSQVDQVADFVKQLPEDYQNAILQQIQPMLQQAQMVMQAQGQGQNQEVM